LQAVLLPSFIAARRLGGNAALSAATRATAGVIVGGLGLVALLGMLLSPLIARMMVVAEPNAAISDEKIRLMVPMVLVFIPQLVCYGVATATSAALNARGRYVAAALSPAVNNVIVVVACVLFRASRHGAVADLHLSTFQFVLIAGGTTLGVLAFSVTPALALTRAGVRWWPTWSPEHPAVRSMRSSFGWASLSIVGTLVPTAAAIALGNGAAGGVAVFVYAFAFFVLPHALIAVTVATTLAPRVAEGWQAGHTREVRVAIDSAMKGSVPLLALAGAGLMALAWPLTRMVAAVGQTASQGQAPIAHTLAAFGPGLLGYGVAFVMIRVLFSLGDVRQASLLMIAGAVVGVVVMVVASLMMPDSQIRRVADRRRAAPGSAGASADPSDGTQPLGWSAARVGYCCGRCMVRDVASATVVQHGQSAGPGGLRGRRNGWGHRVRRGDGDDARTRPVGPAAPVTFTP
jgi:putative peptidoglycan lipid II flippase